MCLGPQIKISEAERFGVLQRDRAFSYLDKGVHLFYTIQYDVAIENGAAEVTENGRHEGTGTEGVQVVPERFDKQPKDLVGEGRRQRLGTVVTLRRNWSRIG